MKTCKKCNTEKPKTEFYKCSKMKDGFFNKCKDCYKADVRRNREDKIDYYRQYDRKRGNRQPPGYTKDYRERYPRKYKATCMVNNAIRDGKLHKEPCEVCGSTDRLHAHHDDYAKPLNVRWLCASHHRQWHMKNGEAKNAT